MSDKRRTLTLFAAYIKHILVSQSVCLSVCPRGVLSGCVHLIQWLAQGDASMLWHPPLEVNKTIFFWFCAWSHPRLL